MGPLRVSNLGVRSRTSAGAVSFVLTIALAFGSLVAPPASAASFNPACGDAAALGSAITTASSNGEDDTITLQAGCTYTLSGTLNVGNDGVGNSLTINGNGATVSGGNTVRVLDVASGAELTIDGLTIANGFTDDNGSGIHNAGTTTITDSLVLDNRGPIDTGNGNGSGAANGGGINNTGSMTVTNTTIAGNKAFRGGGVYNGTGGSMTVTNTTVVDNAQVGSGGGGLGGHPGITVKNTIVANNNGENCGPVTDAGNNIEFGGPVESGNPNTCPAGFSRSDPSLGPLAFNGGPTRTFALGTGSAAINAGTSVGAPTTDQRGATRVNPDIGAYERIPFTFTPSRGDDPAPNGCIPGECSLREAVIGANTAPGSDTIDIPSDTYSLGIAGTKENASATGDLDITGDVNIVGAGAATTVIDANTIDRVIEVRGASPRVIVSIAGVTVRDGSLVGHNDPVGSGGTENNCDNVEDSSCGWGGGIYSAGVLTMNDSIVTANTNWGLAGTQNAWGGGIMSHRGASLTLDHVTVSGNNLETGAVVGGSGVATYGATGAATGTLNIIDSTISGNPKGYAISHHSSVTTITRSTISGNNSSNLGGTGGIFADSGGTLAVANSTISGNTGTTLAGGIVARVPTTLTNVTISANNGRGWWSDQGLSAHTAANTIVAANAGQECNAGLTNTDGNNLDEDDSCFDDSGAADGDIVNTNPNLGALASNGGPTQTHAITATSAATDVGQCTLSTDQRGVTRPQDAGCDIGAYELDDDDPETFFGSVPPDPSNDTTPTFTFSSDEPGTFECKLDSDAFAGCSSPKTLSGVGQGSHTFQVRAVDFANNTDPIPHSYTWTVDTTAPSVQVDTGPSGVTNDNTPTFTFSGEGGATFACSIDTGTASFGACSGAGTHTPSALSDGVYTFRVRATDAAGNEAIATRAFSVDTSAPAVQVDTGPNGPTNDNTPTFTFSGEGDAAFACSVDTGTASFGACSGAGTHTPASALSDGSYTFRVRATDAAGNQAVATRAFSIDTVAPTVSVTGGPSGPTSDTTPTFQFSGSGGSFECSVDQGTESFGACSSSSDHTSSTLTEGAYTFRVRITDAAGNSSTDTRAFSVDTSVPAVQVDTGPAGPTNDNTPTFTFSGESGATFECSVDTGVENFAACSGAGTHTPATALADGSYTFRVRATDVASNTADATRSFIVDSVAPNTTITGPTTTRDRTPRFVLRSTETGSTFRCKLDTATYVSCMSPYTTKRLSFGRHTLLVRAVDAAGNLDATPARKVFEVVR